VMALLLQSAAKALELASKTAAMAVNRDTVFMMILLLWVMGEAADAVRKPTMHELCQLEVVNGVLKQLTVELISITEFI